MEITSLIISLVCFNIISCSYTHSIQPIDQAEKIQSSTVIPGASYCIYEKNDILFGSIECASKHVTFYTYDGHIIQRREHHHDFIAVSKMLDRSAPKPQPTTCILVFWPGAYVAYKRYIGKAGWYIIFYDKNGEAIECYSYDLRKNIIQTKSEKFYFVLTHPFLVGQKFPLDLEHTQYYAEKNNPAITIDGNWKKYLELD